MDAQIKILTDAVAENSANIKGLAKLTEQQGVINTGLMGVVETLIYDIEKLEEAK